MNLNRPRQDEATIEETPTSNWVPALTVLSGPNRGQCVEVFGESFAIGRSRDSRLPINHKAVSRNHAEIIAKSGRFTIKDLNSKWGTKLNGQDITESELKFGDEIEIAGTMINFNMVTRDSLKGPKTRWIRIVLIGLIFAVIAATATLFYFRYQTKAMLERPGGDVLTKIIYHYDMGIKYYNEMSTKGLKNKEKVIKEMKEVIELDPDGKTQFSRSARRIIDGLEK